MMLHKKWLAVCAVMVALFGQCSAAIASSISGQIGVQMVIEPSCRVTSSTSVDEAGVQQWGVLNFGAHNDLTSDKAAAFFNVLGNGGLWFECSKGLTATITVDGGQNGDGALRYMTNTTQPSRKLAYRLYSSMDNTPVIPGMPISVVNSDDGSLMPGYDFIGRVLSSEQSNQMPAAGTYTDTLLITLAW